MHEIKQTYKGCLSGFDLKLLAAVSMFIDHLGAIVFPEAIWMRYVGRLAFPIYCFLLTEGLLHTRDRKQYLKRLVIFALVSEVFFDLAFYRSFFEIQHQNVFFTLSIGLFLLDRLEEENRYLVQLVWIFGIMAAANLLHTDYGAGGVLTILIFYRFRDNRPVQAILFCLLHMLVWGRIQRAAVLALIPIFLYNGQRGKNIKYFFYTFYPAHLLFLTALREIVVRMYG